ncbi:MAG: TetR/AcrR family transcriptional regulator [Ktedonobacterales bacterium]
MSRRVGLDQEAVIQAAADLVDAEGLDALSLARLADSLGVRTPSLYNHISSLDGVRHALAVRGTCELRDRLARAAIGKNGEEGIFAIADAYRHFAKEHPGLYAASLRAATPGDSELITPAEETMSIIRAVLAPYHLSDENFVHAARALRSLAHGFVSLELAGGFGIPVDIDTSYHTIVRMFAASLRDAGNAQRDS